MSVTSANKSTPHAATFSIANLGKSKKRAIDCGVLIYILKQIIQRIMADFLKKLKLGSISAFY